jgi:hypothetical protein
MTISDDTTDLTLGPSSTADPPARPSTKRAKPPGKQDGEQGRKRARGRPRLELDPATVADVSAGFLSCLSLGFIILFILTSVLATPRTTPRCSACISGSQRRHVDDARKEGPVSRAETTEHDVRPCKPI